MSDRYAGFIVTLDYDRKDEDGQHILDAIRMVKGVLSVNPIVSTSELWIAEERARYELGQKLWQVLYPNKD